MQFSLISVLALATAAFAQRAPDANPNFDPITNPEKNEEVLSGTTFTIKWTVPPAFADAKVNILLIGGPEQNKQTLLQTIVTGLDNSLGKYDWDVPADQGGFAFYGITIEDVADTFNNYQYSMPFKVIKNSDAAASSDVSGSASTVTITTASGTAIVTLSTAPVTTTEVSSSTVETTSAVTTEASSEVESTTSSISTLVTVPSASIESTSPTTTGASGSAETSGPAQVNPDSGATQAKAGLFAVVGGMAIAFML